MTHGADDGGAEMEHSGDVMLVDGAEVGRVRWPLIYAVEESIWWKAAVLRFGFDRTLFRRLWPIALMQICS